MQRKNMKEIIFLLECLNRRYKTAKNLQAANIIAEVKGEGIGVHNSSLNMIVAIYESTICCNNNFVETFANTYIELCSLLELTNRTLDMNDTNIQPSALHNIIISALDPLKENYVDISEYEILHASRIEKLVNTCRQCLINIPGCMNILENIREHAKLYCNVKLRSKLNNKYYTYTIRKQLSSYQAMYPEIHWWEILASISSPLLVVLDVITMSMICSDNVDIVAIEKFNFPWFSCYYSTLEHFSMLHNDTLLGFFNPINCYRNLKQLEKRIYFLRKKCLPSTSSNEKMQELLNLLLDSIAILYLSEPGSQYGIYRITSERILKNIGVPLYMNSLKYARNGLKKINLF